MLGSGDEICFVREAIRFGKIHDKKVIEEAEQVASTKRMEEMNRYFLSVQYPLISKKILEENFCHPVCLAYFEINLIKEYPEKVMALIGLAELMVTLAGLMLLAIIRHRHGYGMKEVISLSQKRISFGTWLYVLRKIKNLGYDNLGNLKDTLEIFLRPLNLKRIRKFVSLRNELTHPYRKIPEVVAKSEYESLKTDFEIFMLDFGRIFFDWDLVIPKVSKKSSVVRFLKLRGAKEYELKVEERPVEDINALKYNNTPCLLHYREETLVPLYPFVLWEECPKCYKYEIFIFVGFSQSGDTRYISFRNHIIEFEPGHTISRKLKSYLV